MPHVIDEQHSSREGEIGFDSQSAFKKFQRTWLVQADNLSQFEDDVLQATGLPPIGLFANGTFLKKLKAREVDSTALLWEVTGDYDSAAPELPDDDDPENVLPDWKWSSETEDEVVEVDQVTGKPIVNAVGEPILVTRPASIPVLTITRIEQTFSPLIILAFENHANSTPFWGAPAKLALMAGIGDQKRVVNGTPYREVSYTIKFKIKFDEAGNEIGWKSQPLHHGTKYLKVAGADVADAVPFTDEHKNPSTGNLRADGTKVPDGGDPEYLSFNRFPEADFNQLNLGPY